MPPSNDECGMYAEPVENCFYTLSTGYLLGATLYTGHIQESVGSLYNITAEEAAERCCAACNRDVPNHARTGGDKDTLVDGGVADCGYSLLPNGNAGGGVVHFRSLGAADGRRQTGDPVSPGAVIQFRLGGTWRRLQLQCADTNAELLEKIKHMTLMEAADFIKQIDSTFNFGDEDEEEEAAEEPAAEA